MAADDPTTKVPVPDPTSLTTQALDHEVAALQKELSTAVSTLESSLRSAIATRADLTDAQFKTVDLQFRLIENARIEQKSDTKQAVVDALAAQKEANAKSELVMTAATGELSARFAASTDADRRAAGDLKDRLSVVEGRLNGSPLRERVVAGEGERRGARDNQASLYIALTALVGVAGLFVALYSK